MRQVLFTLLILFVMPKCAVSGDFDDGLVAYDRQDYTTAFAKFKNAATGSIPPYNEWLEIARSEYPDTSDEKLGWVYLTEDIIREGNRKEAQFYLGILYAKGLGVSQNEQQAVQWYRRAIESDHEMALFNLAVLYTNGQGAPQNYQEAMRWYTKAAEAGHTGAQYVLAVQYFHGKDRPQDYVLAYMWANLAASHGDSDAINERRDIAKVMTPSQLAVAQQLVREWKPKVDSIPDRLQADRGGELVASGTGFVVSRQGHILTSHHVVEKCGSVRATAEGRTKRVTVAGIDAENDLALLQLPAAVSSIARFREGRTIRPGDGVVVVGFPMPGLLATGAQVTTGTVSALAGLGNNTRFIQISAPVQPGNSGGPLLDQGGNIVGIVVSKLNALTIAKTTGDIPQNINFAINGAIAKAFLDSQSVEYETGAPSLTLESADIGAAARTYTLRLECYR